MPRSSPTSARRSSAITAAAGAGAQLEYRCLAHDDTKASAAFNPAKARYRCQACGARGGLFALAQALGLPLPDRVPPGVVKRTIYALPDERGRLLAEHVRDDRADGSKAVWWRRPGRANTGLDGVKLVDLPLYGIVDVLGAPPGAPVVCVEGEKARDALAAVDILAVGTVTGASALPSDAVLRSLAGHPVVLWPDNDPDGVRHMRRIAARLAALDVPTVRWVVWPDAPSKGDAADVQGGRAALDALLDAAGPVPEPAADAASPPPAAPPALDTIRLTDVGNAQRFVADFGADVPYCAVWKKWLCWDGRRWAVDDRLVVREYAKRVTSRMLAEAAGLPVGDAQKALAEHALRAQKADRLRAMLELAQSDPVIAVVPAELDCDPWLLNVANGTVDLRTGALRPHQRADLLTKLAPVAYDPAARSPLWERFLSEALRGNAALVAFLQRCTGYTLTGTTGEEVLFFLHGPEAAGKSTFAEALKATLGDYARTTDFETFVQKRGDRGVPNDIAALVGARLVVSIEVGEGKRLAEGLVKQLTGGDTVAARFLFGEFFEFVPQFKLWLAANEAPRIRHNDRAMWRRILRIPFEHIVPEGDRDPTVKATFKDPAVSGPPILAWAVEGCRAWQRDRLEVPDEVSAATASYREEQDPLRECFADCFVFDATAWASSRDLYGTYRDWAEANGISKPLTSTAFGMRLADHGCRQGKVSETRGWHGVWLRSAADTDPAPPDTGQVRTPDSPILSSNARTKGTYTETGVGTCPVSGNPDPEPTAGNAGTIPQSNPDDAAEFFVFDAEEPSA